MLESSSLSLGPWVGCPALVQRDIRDAQTGRRLGLARWRISPVAGWRGWFRRAILEVMESEDESLLCTLCRVWRPLPVWDVLDADGRLIGSFRRGVLLDSWGRGFAVLRPSADSGPKTFLDPQGQPTGTLTSTPEGPQLTFAASVEENPFAKMILLAAALVE